MYIDKFQEIPTQNIIHQNNKELQMEEREMAKRQKEAMERLVHQQQK